MHGRPCKDFLSRSKQNVVSDIRSISFWKVLEKKIEMLKLQPLAKGGMVSSGLDVYGRVAEMEQTWTLQYCGCWKQTHFFPGEPLNAPPREADSGSPAILQSVCPHQGRTWGVTLLLHSKKWYSITSGNTTSSFLKDNLNKPSRADPGASAWGSLLHPSPTAGKWEESVNLK